MKFEVPFSTCLAVSLISLLSLLNHVSTEEIARLPRKLLMDISRFLAGALLTNNYTLGTLS
jgi:hypothetical protein